MTVFSLIDSARGRLGDEKSQRWSDKRLISIVSQGQANICKATGLYRKEVYIPLANGRTRYLLPLDCIRVKRIEYSGTNLDVLTRRDYENLNVTLADTDFVALKDNLDMNKLELIPAPSDITTDVIVTDDTGVDSFLFTSTVGVVTIMDVPYVVAPTVGVITSTVESLDEVTPGQHTTVFGEITSTPELTEPNGLASALTSDLLGVTTNISAAGTTPVPVGDKAGFIVSSDVYKVVGHYGLVGTVADYSNVLHVYYEAVPALLSLLADSLVIPDIWEEAMMRYIVGTALQDDNDANNIQRGELELQKYTVEVAKANEVSSKDFASVTDKKYNTNFRRI